MCRCRGQRAHTAALYGCDDPKAGAARTLYRLLDDARLNHQVEVVSGVLATESAALLKSFFLRLRRPEAGLGTTGLSSE